MSKKVLIRKQAGSGGIMYTRDIGRGQGGGFRQDLAALRGGAMGLNPQGGQSFIPGAQLPGAAPTRMQRLGAGANLAGRGLAAALTGLQTAYGLQGGNVGALGSVADTYAQNVPGLTRNNPTEAQQGQNIATEAYNQNQQAMAQNAVQQSAQQIMNPNQSGPTGNPLPGQTQGTPLGQLSPPAGLPAPPVPAQTPQAAQAAPAQAAPASAVDPTLSQTLGGFGLQTDQQTGTQLPPMQPQTLTGTGFEQTTFPQGQSPAPAVPATQDPRVDYQNLTIDGIRFGSQTAFDMALQRRMNRSFATYVLNEFGDMLHKADPHIAGLLAFRVYMDKVMR